jgi:hypothetical protein
MNYQRMIPECGHPWAPFQGAQQDGSCVCHACVAEMTASRARRGTLRHAFLDKRNGRAVLITWAGIAFAPARVTSTERRSYSISGKRVRVVAHVEGRTYYGHGPGMGMCLRFTSSRGVL